MRRIHLRGGINLFYRLDRSDIYTIHEVWIEEIYRLPGDIKPKVVVDLGANIGLTSLWLATHYDVSHLIAVEPSAANAQIASLNLTRNNVRAHVLEAAVGSEDGMVLFDQGPGATNGRVVDYTDPAKTNVVLAQTPVRMVSMATVLQSLPDEAKVDFLKLDIEGGEDNLLSGDIHWLARVEALLVEFHPALIDYTKARNTVLRSGLQCVRQASVDENTMELFVRPVSHA